MMKQSTSFAQVATNLLNVLQGYTKGIRFVAVLTVLLTMGFGQVWGQEKLVYTLTPASGSNNSYAGNCDVEIDDITWNLTGNSTTTYWRIGGKSITDVDRALYSKTAIQKDISKIVISHGAANSITVNSVTLIVSTASNGAGTTISTLSSSFSANTTMTFTRPDGKSWANAYYKIVYNVTVSGNSNKFIEFKDAKFYEETAPALSYTVNWYVNETKEHSQTDIAGTTLTNIPDLEDYECGGKVFVGWTTQSSYEHATDAPNDLITNTTGMTIPENGEDYYAVFANVETTPGETTTSWVKTDIASISSDNEVVITMSKSGTTWALRDDNGTSKAPVAEVVTIQNGQIISTIVDNMIWIIEKSNNNLTFYKDNEKSNWLYCNSSNDGVRVGTNDEKKLFTIDASSGYLKNTATSRYVGVYVTNLDWRCYTSCTGNSNIADQTLAFYKKTQTSTSTETITNYTTLCTTEPTVCLIHKNRYFYSLFF